LTQPASIAARYSAAVAEGRLDADPAQRAAIARLDALADRLAAARLARKSSALGWLFAKRTPEPLPRGLYIWGSVGRGKTMLMDMFFEGLPVQGKRRAHFHAFMADVHERVHAWRQDAKAGRVRGDDPIAPVAAALAEEAWVLCFDEFTVTDIADAMILGRLFQALWAAGVVVVATSNVEPQDLYKEGLNRALFLPFIDKLLAEMQVLKLDARTDYRLEKLAGKPVYHVPADAAGRAALDDAWRRLTGDRRPRPRVLKVRTRELTVPAAADGVARFAFPDLCAQPLGASDYLMIARDFHTVIVDDIPAMTAAMRNEAKRFITLIDVLYENHVKLIASADAEPDQLYDATDGREAFEFSRTASRLIEMRSEAYLSLPHGRTESRGGGNTTGLVET
jgi:cell division protein ZapE